MSSSDPRRAGLSDAKRALLERRLRGDAAPSPRRDTITRCAGPGPEHPASFAQERMWFLARFDPGSPMYNVPVAVLLGIGVDVPLLERAWSEVVRRHEALRTGFRMGSDGVLRQVVHEPFAVEIEVVDVRHRVGERFADGVNALVAEEGSRPFDLERPPLFRVTLLRVSERDYAMVTTMHHIVTDGWAYPLMNREVVEIYEAFRAGRPSPLPEPRLRYADFAVWQRERLTGQRLAEQVEYWRERLAGAPPVELPADRPRPPVVTNRGGFHRFRFGGELEARLRELCRSEAATLNMVLMGGFFALLKRLTGQDDLVVGTLLGNRPLKEMEEIVGVFVNTAALRVDLGGDPTFREVVARAKRAVLEADRHQDLPFEKLVEELHVPRDLSRHPVFQVLYFHHVFVRIHMDGAEGPLRSELDMRPVHAENDTDLVDTGVAKFDLMVATVETGAGLGGVFEYAADLFDPETIERMADTFHALLDAASRAPELPVSALSLVSERERRVLLEEWGAGAALQEPPALAPRRFEVQAARTPAAPAVACGGESVSFGELDAWAARIAAGLRSRGVRRGDVVGVRLERSAGMVAALLGCWKAGAAYLPLDPALPPERAAFMLQDSGARLVLSSQPEVPEGVAALPLPPRPAPGERVDGAAVELGAPDLAYLIYTSGSTGTPKGVEVEHGSLAAHLAGYQASPGVDAGGTLLAVTTLSFDISLPELFAPLLAGGRVVVASREQGSDGLALGRLMEEEGVTVMQATPATWQLLLRSGWRGRPELRAACGGEALTAELAEALLERTGELWNVYGPTETTVWDTAGRVEAPGAGIVPLGRPMAGSRVYVLDERLRPVPAGVPGEMHIGGAGVARGYRRRPGLTAERFLPDPFRPEPGARMYRTGDRARWSPAGELVFMGRLDAQVKVRGHRIEPGEVESALQAHPAVAAAAVAARADASGDTLLVAYVVAGDGARDAAELRAWLRGRLPEYMVPSLFVPLEAIPLTPGGKMDRRALPDPVAEAAAPPERVAPRDALEDAIAEIWSEVLGCGEVGVTESFFESGGHSLSATQVLVRIRESLEVDLPIRTFFADPTIAGLAAAVRHEGSPVLEEMMAELEGLSEEEIAELLAGDVHGRGA